LVIIYRPGRVVGPPTDWEAIFRLGQPVAFPAGDAQALAPLILYRSLGGEIADAQRRPFLQPEVLAQVLQLLVDGEERGLFPFWLSQYETYPQVWQAYHDERVNVSIAWASSYLTTLPADSAALPIPPLVGSEGGAVGTSLTLATGWGWAIADPLPEHRALAARLAEYLSESDFMAAWSEAAGYLPTRPSALAGWNSGSLKTLFSPIAASAQARPSNDLLSSQGPVLKDAVMKILKRETDATQAAQAAAERLIAPQAR
jgi:multiple sugar transport system substrate-binding protein